jgi:tRNA nucleotidyltransferase (CCA-adding enzyme)
MESACFAIAIFCKVCYTDDKEPFIKVVRMRTLLPESLLRLADACPTPLYVVGGSVRDFLAKLTPCQQTIDWDVCAPLDAETFAQVALQQGFTVRSVFKNTGTVKLTDANGVELEYSCFRSDTYVRGTHVPIETHFTDDICLDARRRDFTANAVYYHIQAQSFVDPLHGIRAIKEKRLTTVAPAEKVFSEDGLRLMRLARQAATLGFTPDLECLQGAMQNAELICDISPERIYTELIAILHADKKYGIPYGQYTGLSLLSQTRVLDYILPELSKGRDMPQRTDFHSYDVLEHSLRAVRYAHPSIRLAALLHDVGKPFCQLRDGNSHAHPEEGALLAKAILTRLKAPKQTIAQTCALIALHMYDFNCKTGENKLRRFFVQHYPLLQDLLLLKQADFSACKDDLSPAPTCVRWQTLLQTLQEENAPLHLKQLAVNGKDLLAIGCMPANVSSLLQRLLLHAVVCPADNQKQRLIKLACSWLKT